MEIEWNKYFWSNNFFVHSKRKWILHCCGNEHKYMFCDKYSDCCNCECTSNSDNHCFNCNNVLSRWISCIECKYRNRSFVSMEIKRSEYHWCDFIFIHRECEWFLHRCGDEHFNMFFNQHSDCCYRECAAYCDDYSSDCNDFLSRR